MADIAGVYDPTENFSDDDDDETDDDERESEPEIDYESEDESLAEVVEYLEKKMVIWWKKLKIWMIKK